MWEIWAENAQGCKGHSTALQYWHIPQVAAHTKDYGRIRLSVSTLNRTYELSGITHVTLFPKYGKHSTGPSSYGPWVRTYSKSFSCKPVLTVCSYRAQSNEIFTYGEVSRGSVPRVRRYGLLYLRAVEYDLWLWPLSSLRAFSSGLQTQYPQRLPASWWNIMSSFTALRHHQMETCSVLLAICVGNSLVTNEFPTQRPEIRSFDVFFDLSLDRRLTKQSWGWWFEMPSRSLWHHCNEPSIWGSYLSGRYTEQCWQLNTLSSGQNGHHFFKCFSLIKMFEFWLKFHWNVFPAVQLTKF